MLNSLTISRFHRRVIQVRVLLLEVEELIRAQNYFSSMKSVLTKNQIRIRVLRDQEIFTKV